MYNMRQGRTEGPQSIGMNFRLTTLYRHKNGNEHRYLYGLLKMFPMHVAQPLIAAMERAKSNDRRRHIPCVYTASHNVYHLGCISQSSLCKYFPHKLNNSKIKYITVIFDILLFADGESTPIKKRRAVDLGEFMEVLKVKVDGEACMEQERLDLEKRKLDVTRAIHCRRVAILMKLQAMRTTMYPGFTDETKGQERTAASTSLEEKMDRHLPLYVWTLNERFTEEDCKDMQRLLPKTWFDSFTMAIVCLDQTSAQMRCKKPRFTDLVRT